MSIVLIFVLLLALSNSVEILKPDRCSILIRPLQAPAVVFNERDSIFVLGGIRTGEGEPWDGFYSRQVILFNVSDRSNGVVGEFPYPVAKGSAALDPNGDILHLGGAVQRARGRKGAVEATGDIFIIRRNNLQPQLLDQTLNVPRIGAAVVTIGDVLYLFGGDYCGGEPCQESTIEEFNMTTRNARIIGTFSSYKGDNSAVYDGLYAYIFGGYGASENSYESKSIHRCDPKTFNMESLGELLPFGVEHTGAAIVDNKVYLMAGGNTHGGGRPDAYTFDTLNQTVSYVDFDLGSTSIYALQRPGVVYAAKTNIVCMFGLYNGGNHNSIYCLRLPPNKFI